MSAVLDNRIINLPGSRGIDQNDSGFYPTIFLTFILSQFKNVAVLHDEGIVFRDAAFYSQLAMLDEHAELTMNGHEEFGLAQIDHQLLLFAASMTGNVHASFLSVNDIGTTHEQRVYCIGNRALVSWNRRGRYDHSVALDNLDLFMLIIGDPRQG